MKRFDTACYSRSSFHLLIFTVYIKGYALGWNKAPWLLKHNTAKGLMRYDFWQSFFIEPQTISFWHGIFQNEMRMGFNKRGIKCRHHLREAYSTSKKSGNNLYSSIFLYNVFRPIFNNFAASTLLPSYVSAQVVCAFFRCCLNWREQGPAPPAL